MAKQIEVGVEELTTRVASSGTFKNWRIKRNVTGTEFLEGEVYGDRVPKKLQGAIARSKPIVACDFSIGRVWTCDGVFDLEGPATTLQTIEVVSEGEGK
jgi:hypothetical protein